MYKARRGVICPATKKLLSFPTLMRQQNMIIQAASSDNARPHSGVPKFSGSIPALSCKKGICPINLAEVMERIFEYVNRWRKIGTTLFSSTKYGNSIWNMISPPCIVSFVSEFCQWVLSVSILFTWRTLFSRYCLLEDDLFNTGRSNGAVMLK